MARTTNQEKEGVEMKTYTGYSVGGFARNGMPIGTEGPLFLDEAREEAMYLADAYHTCVTVWGWYGPDPEDCDAIESFEG